MSEVARRIRKREVVVVNETGVKLQTHTESPAGRFSRDGFDIIWVGKFDFRKQLSLALRIIAEVRELDGLRLHIVGSGSESLTAEYKRQASELGIEDICIWHGQVSHGEVSSLMSASGLLLFTSLSEGTPAVVLEAIGNRLPVLCFDVCGFGDVVDDRIGVKIPVTVPNYSVRRFAEAIMALHDDRERLQRMSAAASTCAEELQWDNKARRMLDLYDKARACFDKRSGKR
jgi:glycosyltransferase involved in cell wall biosynthesis